MNFDPTDHAWLFNGSLESDELRTDTFARRGALTLRGIAKVILCGIFANICVESHLRDPLEQGFDGYAAALVNFAFLAHAVPSTDEVIAAMAVSTRAQT